MEEVLNAQYVLMPHDKHVTFSTTFRVYVVGSLVHVWQQKLSELTQLMPGATQPAAGKAGPKGQRVRLRIHGLSPAVL